jgi:hypothetical protein
MLSILDLSSPATMECHSLLRFVLKTAPAYQVVGWISPSAGVIHRCNGGLRGFAANPPYDYQDFKQHPPFHLRAIDYSISP